MKKNSKNTEQRLDYVAIICPYSMNRKYSMQITHKKFYILFFLVFISNDINISNKNDREKLERLEKILSIKIYNLVVKDRVLHVLMAISFLKYCWQPTFSSAINNVIDKTCIFTIWEDRTFRDKHMCSMINTHSTHLFKNI